jgi:hypothetical protein
MARTRPAGRRATMASRAGNRRPTWRDSIGALLLHVCALGALLAAAASVVDVRDAGPATRGVEVWRSVGYLYFGAVFVLLARAPRRLRWLWEVTIVAKLALPLAALTVVADADDATSFLVFDGLLVLALAAAYLLTAGWTAELPRRSTAASLRRSGQRYDIW